MKETGLMFKAPLVRAILSGQKTQTRRVVKWRDLQKGLNLGFSGLRATKTANGWVLESDSRSSSEWRCKPTRCPMGQPGDRIYVRETWNPDPPCDGTWGYTAWAGCRGGQIEGVPEQFRSPEHCMYAATSDADLVWTPSIHMPKWAARIWLEITGVRVERLQQISEVDCRAEGAHGGHGSIPGYAYSATPKEHFQHIWESTGGDWAANPCVWVIDFKQIPLPREQGS